jgi:hypothetical protein
MSQAFPNILARNPAGKLVPLNVDADGKLLVSVAGGVSFPLVGTPDATINGAAGTISTPPGNLILTSGQGASDQNGGQVAIASGSGTGLNSTGGGISIQTGDGNQDGGPLNINLGRGDNDGGGSFNLSAGPSSNSAGGNVSVSAGFSSSTTLGGGFTQLRGGTDGNNLSVSSLTLGGNANGSGGFVEIDGGQGVADGGDLTFVGGPGGTAQGGNINLNSGSSNTGAGGDIVLTAGNNNIGDRGGNITMTTGNGDNAAGDIILTTLAAGRVIINNVPTADPHVLNALWNNAGVLSISAG